MKVKSISLFVLGLIFLHSLVNAQFLDSLKTKSKKVSTSIESFFKKNQKDKADSQKQNSSVPAQSASGEFETKTISFNTKGLRSIKIPVYNNLPIIETMHTATYSSLPQMKGVEKDIEIYRYLVELNVLEVAYKSRKSPVEKQPNNNDPSSYLNNSLQKLLKWGLFDENAIQKYFCNPEAASQYKCAEKWGGSQADEFRQKKIYEDFLNSGIYESLQKTANGLSKEIYFRHTYLLNEYNFNKKGFLVQFSASNGWAIAELLKETHFLLPMSAGEAEALKEKIKTKDSYGRNIYPLQLLYKLEFLKSTAAINKKFVSGQPGNKALIAELAQPIVHLYTDPELKNKLTDINLSGLLRGVEAANDEVAGSEGIVSLLTVQLKSDQLRDFKILGYKNLPLLGLNVNYEKTLERFSLPGEKNIDYTPYDELITVYGSMDKLKNRKSPFTSRESEHFREAHLMNMMLVKALQSVVTDQAYNDFFCKDMACAEEKQKNNGAKWGGYRGDEFDQRAAYKKFENSGIEQSLYKAAQAITRQAYFVNRSMIRSYDFDKEGFPIDLSVPNTLSKSLGTASMNSQGNIQLLYKIPPDKAKEFKNKYPRMSESFPTVNTVVKVEMKFDAAGNKTFEIIDRSVDIYMDDALLNKITTIRIETK